MTSAEVADVDPDVQYLGPWGRFDERELAFGALRELGDQATVEPWAAGLPKRFGCYPAVARPLTCCWLCLAVSAEPGGARGHAHACGGVRAAVFLRP